jgi:UDP-N-acetylmuramoylalanine--D-glutamate ligase
VSISAIAMISKTPWRKACVVGLGATGFSCACYLDNLGVEVSVFDSRLAPPFAKRLRQEKPDIKSCLGEFDEDEFRQAEVLVVSPGVSLADPSIQAARDAGVEIVGDIELFCRAARRPVIGITGSNGKSTVTKLVEELLEAAGIDVLAGGNIGRPALDLLSDPEPACYLLELSSFQLETTSSLVTEVAAILNISPDHMDRYPDLRSYTAAKTSIAGSAATLVLSRDDPILVSQLSAMAQTPNVVTFGLNCPPSRKDFGVVQQNSVDWLIKGGEALLPTAGLKIEGRHNIANALAALAIADAIVSGKTTEMVGVLREFTGLPHRCEFVGDYRGVRWINDSKGTNVGATVAALEGIGRPVVLIAGGQAKNADFSPLARSAQRFARQVVLFGEDCEQISGYLSPTVSVTTVTTLDEATRLAAEWAQPGDVVLFSPACASFDMFDNFEHRGDTFRELFSGISQ